MKSPVSILLLNEARAQLPTFGKAALNTAHWLTSKALPRSNVARKIYHGVLNWYEGGWPLTTGGKFSYLPSLVQDARWDQNYVTRREMLRRMRYWSQNSPLVEAILSVGERYTVGSSGLHISFYPDSDISDDADNWYERADLVIAEWFQNCGWNGETMAELLKIAYRCQKVDGEIFILKTRKSLPLNLGNRTIQVQKPVMQLVESHRVESPWNQWEDEGRHLIDGVQYQIVQSESTTPDGKKQHRDLLSKIGYWTRNGMGSFEQNDSWYLMPCDSVWQICNRQRTNQPRAVSDFYAVEVNINKLEDVIDIELSAQNAQSVRAVAIKSASGQATASALDKKIEAINLARNITAKPNTADADFEKRSEIFRKETGAYVFGLKSGEDAINMSPNRPSEATLNLLEYLVNSICSGAKAPRCLVFEKISGQSAKGQGTEVRAVLDNANGFYSSEFQKWKSFVREAAVYFMEWAVKNDPRVADAPADWKNCIHIQQPEACNVDVGNNMTAGLMSLAAGTDNYHTLLAPRGLNPVTVFKQLSREQKMIERLGIKLTLPALLPGQLPLDGKPPQQKQEAVEA